MQIEALATLLHGATSVFPRDDGSYPRPWGELSDQDHESAILLVQTLLQERETVLGLPSPEGLHLRWATEKQTQGWVYGKEFSEARKTHPCLVSWQSLSEESQIKDVIWWSLLTTLGDLVPPRVPTQCSRCRQVSFKVTGCLPTGPSTEWTHRYACPECGCKQGCYHHFGCTYERCGQCGGQAWSCGCKI